VAGHGHRFSERNALLTSLGDEAATQRMRRDPAERLAGHLGSRLDDLADADQSQGLPASVAKTLAVAPVLSSEAHSEQRA
jgi:hypothetical protein